MLDHHINDGALTPRQGHEQCEGRPSLFPTERYLFIYLTKIGDFLNKIYNYKDTLHKTLCISCSPRNFPII